MDRYDREREQAALDKIAASMEVALHGVPRDRASRLRLEAVLGTWQPRKVNGDYDPLRHGLR